MSMLAGPRRKQKVINLRAKNSTWSNDTNKFGQRMLEKMGWSSGKGLGAKENGIVEHVVARYKNDEKGLGFEDRNDQWTKHEDDFNALLSNLSNGDSKEEKLHSGISLEHKSKKSKARVHYHKFTRGKDLTRYSEKDLANIFGKKSLKKIEEKKPEVLIEDTVAVKETEQVFTEKGSMEDYFKNKLSALKTKISFNYRENDDEADYSFRGFAGAEQESEEPSVAFQGFSFYNKDTVDPSDAVDPDIVTNVEKPKKKKKNKSKKHINETENCVDDNELPKDIEPIKKKKSKTNRNQIDNELNPNEIKTKKKKSKTNHAETDTNEVKTRKKKSKSNPENEMELPDDELLIKRKSQENLEGMDNQNDMLVNDSYVPKKKKKRKNKD